MINSNFRKKMADSWFSYLQIQICKEFEFLENNKDFVASISPVRFFHYEYNTKKIGDYTLDDQTVYKRINKETGKPFKQGYEDENGRIFYSYVNKIGNDGWYLEEWKKDMESFKAKKSQERNNE